MADVQHTEYTYVHQGRIPLPQHLVGRGGARVDAAQPEQDVLAELFLFRGFV